MKNNKGFVGIGFIIAVIAILAVSGGAVYFMKKPPTPTLQNIGNNILPLVNQNTVVNNNTDTNKPKIDCLATTTPSITILYPNGGETFTVGQKMIIKWSSCNVNNVHIGLLSGGKDFGELTMTPISASLGLFQVMVFNPAQAFTQSDINNYQIGIYSQLPDVLVKSNSFTVQSPVQNKTIILTQPLNQAVWNGGNKYTISWTSGTGNVALSTCSTNYTNTGYTPQQCVPIVSNKPSSGSYSYILPAGTSTNSGLVEIKATDSTSTYDSHIVKVNNSSILSAIGE